MKLIEKIKLHIYGTNFKYREIIFLGKSLITYKRADKLIKIIGLLGINLEKVPLNKQVFYLKINRISDYTLPCIQHWINIIGGNCHIVFICDNKKLKYQIKKHIAFPEFNYLFIPSLRKLTNPITKHIATKYWKKATDAHLTSFIHAEKNRIRNYWTIDADDTMLLQDPHKIHQMMKKVENYASCNSIDAFSLDMWRSRTKGKHWSMGVVYISDNPRILSLLRANNSLDWTKQYSHLDVAFNLDWFFNYLSSQNLLSVKSFYFNNYYFIHWGNFIRNCIGSSICFWSENQLHYPILEYVFKNNRLGTIPIADCVQFFDDTTLASGINFLENEVTILHFWPKELKELNDIKNFGCKSKFCY